MPFSRFLIVFSSAWISSSSFCRDANTRISFADVRALGSINCRSTDASFAFFSSKSERNFGRLVFSSRSLLICCTWKDSRVFAGSNVLGVLTVEVSFIPIGRNRSSNDKGSDMYNTYTKKAKTIGLDHNILYISAGRKIWQKTSRSQKLFSRAQV